MNETVKYIYGRTNDEFYDIMDVGEAYIFDDLDLDAGWLRLCLVLYKGGYKDFEGLNTNDGVLSYDAVEKWVSWHHTDGKEYKILKFAVGPVGDYDTREWIEEHILSEIKDAQDKLHNDMFDQSLLI